MVTKGRNNIKVKKEKKEQRLILSPHKGRKREEKEQKSSLSYIQIMLEFTLIRNWFLSLVNFSHHMNLLLSYLFDVTFLNVMNSL